MKESRIEFIKEAHKEATQDWKVRIENEFTNIDFKPKLEIGAWYKDDGWLVCFTKIKGEKHSYFGVNCGEWVNDGEDIININYETFTKATNKEVEEALINEAKKRGFKEGNYKSLLSGDRGFKGWYFCEQDNSLYTNLDGEGGDVVFKNGKWATIIDQPTKLTVEQVEEKLGYKVEIIS